MLSWNLCVLKKEQVMKTMGKVTFEEFIGRLQAVQKEFPDDVEVVLNRGAKQIAPIVAKTIKEN